MSFLAGAATVAVATTLAAAFAGWTVFLELRAGRERRRLRLLALGVAWSALCWLATEPARLAAGAVTGAVLLTDGATGPAIAAARQAAGSDAPVFLLGADAALAAGQPIPDAAWLGRRRPDIGQLQVAGHGLDAAGLEALEAIVSLHGEAAAGPGPIAIGWRRELSLGEQLIVHGVLSPATDARHLRLVGPGGDEDDVELDGGGGFRLRARPRHAGQHLYRLVAETGDGPREWSVDVDVRAQAALRVLWLEGAPGFAVRHLAPWLTSDGTALVVRTRLTRGRWRVTTHHHPQIELERIGADALAGFDLVITDLEALTSLGDAERLALTAAIEDDGLGLLVRGGGADPGPLPAPLDDYVLRTVGGAGDTLIVHAELDGEEAPPLRIDGREIAPAVSLAPLVHDGSDRVLAAVARHGSGRVAATVLHGSHRWRLAGEARAHARYWSRLIGGVARPGPRRRWRAAAGPALIDRGLELAIESDHARITCTVAAGAGPDLALAPRQDPLDPRRHGARLWPRVRGWHRLDGGDEPGWVYVQDSGDWGALEEIRRRAATSLRATRDRTRPPASPPSPTPRPLPRWPAFALLLAAVALLWADERIG